MTKEFDYYRILKVDYAAYFSLWIMILPWLFYLLIFLPGAKLSVTYWTIAMMVISLIGLILLVRRMRFLKHLYVQGVDSIGRIDSTRGQERGGSLVLFTYDYQGENCLEMNNLRTSLFYRYGFLEGDEIAVRLNPNKPHDAVMRDVFFSIDEDRTSFIVPKVYKSMAQRKLIDRDLQLLPSEVVFADVWTSGRVDTDFSLSQFADATVEFGRNKYRVNTKRNRIFIRNNLTVNINTAKLLNKHIITLEFRRYYNRFYVVYFIFSAMMGFVITDYISGYGIGHLTLLFLLFPLVILQGFYKSEIGIKTFKLPDYPREVQNAYFEILDAVREKEIA
ncbi:hypothetical protein [Methanolobus sp.]|jgi:hypothetical protein|uniref:hypothetical protein n=1 Tax=Methanolobus sp. TaxID=1874737 RepID=UPI0025D7AB80|nr:hypothetical protein [Methanolobus sp.]